MLRLLTTNNELLLIKISLCTLTVTGMLFMVIIPDNIDLFTCIDLFIILIRCSTALIQVRQSYSVTWHKCPCIINFLTSWTRKCRSLNKNVLGTCYNFCVVIFCWINSVLLIGLGSCDLNLISVLRNSIIIKFYNYNLL